jgi:hypothetical protein
MSMVRDRCTACGGSRSSMADACGKACHGCRPRTEARETPVHERARHAARMRDEMTLTEGLLTLRHERPSRACAPPGSTTRLERIA